MLDLLAGFIQELRTAGLPVSLTETLDAMEAVQHIPIVRAEPAEHRRIVRPHRNRHRVEL